MSDVIQTLTHSELIAQSAKWLERQGCAVVITDMSHGKSETPDAIGWKGTLGILVECKASRADFIADKQKYFRRYPEEGMGQNRYFCAKPGMIGVDELPTNWGLLEWDGKRMRCVQKSERHSRNSGGHCAEISLLLSAIRRLGNTSPKGVSVKFYTIDSKNRATIGVDVELTPSSPTSTEGPQCAPTGDPQNP